MREGTLVGLTVQIVLSDPRDYVTDVGQEALTGVVVGVNAEEADAASLLVELHPPLEFRGASLGFVRVTARHRSTDVLSLLEGRQIGANLVFKSARTDPDFPEGALRPWFIGSVVRAVVTGSADEMTSFSDAYGRWRAMPFPRGGGDVSDNVDDLRADIALADAVVADDVIHFVEVGSFVPNSLDVAEQLDALLLRARSLEADARGADLDVLRSCVTYVQHLVWVYRGFLASGNPGVQ